jgi:hypothetical protein
MCLVRNDTAKTSIRSHIYHHTTPRESVICDSGGMTVNLIAHQ